MKKLGLMTVAEAAEYLNVPRPTLYQHLREGHIPGIQIGGRWRIEQDKLNDFIGKAKRGGSESYEPIMDENGYAPDRHSPRVTPQEQPISTENSEVAERLVALRAENARLRELVADQLLELERLRATPSTT